LLLRCGLHPDGGLLQPLLQLQPPCPGHHGGQVGHVTRAELVQRGGKARGGVQQQVRPARRQAAGAARRVLERHQRHHELARLEARQQARG